jgi:hypothetical protein
MRIAVYALAKNERKHVEEWAASCVDADFRVVTDTGSTDGTAEALMERGVTVRTGYVCPWRWDDAHNLSLNHVPPDADVCIRLDLDERLQPGWRQAIERAWTGDVNNLRYHYVWSWAPDGSEGLTFHCDRVHARRGFRWAQATHEGLVCWTGDKRQAWAEGLAIHHHRDAGKKHVTDLTLLEVAVREAPHDARAQWYLAREMDYAGMPEAADAFRRYLGMDGGQATERATPSDRSIGSLATSSISTTPPRKPQASRTDGSGWRSSTTSGGSGATSSASLNRQSSRPARPLIAPIRTSRRRLATSWRSPSGSSAAATRPYAGLARLRQDGLTTRGSPTTSPP